MKMTPFVTYLYQGELCLCLSVPLSSVSLSLSVCLSDATWNFMALALLTCRPKQVSHPQLRVL